MTKNDGFRSPYDLPHCVTVLIPEFSSSDCCRAWATTAGRMVPRGSLPRSASAAALVATRVRHLLSLIARVLAPRLPHWRPLRSSSLPPAVLVVAHPEEGEEAARLSHFPPSPVYQLVHDVVELAEAADRHHLRQCGEQ